MPERDKGRSRFQNRFFLLSYHRKLKLFFRYMEEKEAVGPPFYRLGGQ